jgi:hypothetical protein
MNCWLNSVVLKIENKEFSFYVNVPYLYEPFKAGILLYQSDCQFILQDYYTIKITNHFGNAIEQMTRLKYNQNIKFK